MISYNGGIEWIDRSAPFTNILNSGTFAEYSAVNKSVHITFAVGENGVILRSTDDGKSWITYTEFTTNELNDILIYDQNNYYICGNNGTLLKSTDHGISWEHITIKSGHNLKRLISLPAGSSRVINLLSVGQNGECQATINMVDWFPVTLPLNEDILSITSKGSIIICGTQAGKVLRSENRGITWNVISSGLATGLYQLEFVNETIVIGSSSFGMTTKSTDSGITWIAAATPVTQNITGMSFGSSTYGIAGGTIDSLLFTTNGGSSWVMSLIPVSRSKTPQTVISSLKNYPNPFNPVTTVNYTLQKPGLVSLIVYDMTGKVVKILINSNQNEGSHSVNFEANALASSIYFYVLKFNDGVSLFTETNKMILVK
jgi:photosystem II stability/assembly factor-like uncharacterized protein